MSKKSSKEAVVRSTEVADEYDADEYGTDQFKTINDDASKTAQLGLCEGVPKRLR